MNPAPAPPPMDAAALLAAAEAQISARQLSQAFVFLEQAERAGADANHCAGQFWLAHMLKGDFESAWQVSDALRRKNAPDPNRFWQGEDLRGQRVIVRSLHGLGDAVQMLRYLPSLLALAAEVILEVPPELVSLAPCFRAGGDVRIFTWGEHAPAQPPDWDVQLEIMELPYIFRTHIDDLPIAERYLQLPGNEITKIKSLIGQNTSRRRIGMVWAASDWNPSRSVPLKALLPIVCMPGYEFWSLQGGAAAAEWPAVADGRGHLHDAASCGSGVLALAAVLSQMDLVLTVDTLAAHLAGSLGVPAWVLLEHTADWRWMLNRSTTPWYPTLRLFRQQVPGDWSAPVLEVSRQLAEKPEFINL